VQSLCGAHGEITGTGKAQAAVAGKKSPEQNMQRCCAILFGILAILRKIFM
jgi:hypothetical protein